MAAGAAHATIRPMRPDEVPACEGILRALPDWFGIESAIVDYVRDVGVMETFVAARGNEILGFLTLNHHNESSAEMHVLGVLPHEHGQGLGRLLVECAEATLRERSVQFLQVKTLAPSRPCEHYARTRGFYRHLGYLPLEENKLWGDANPCLILVKHLVCGGA